MSGKSFEAWLGAELQDRMSAGELVAWQLPTPYKILEVSGGFFRGVFQRSTIDFLGALRPGGRVFGIEAKETDNGKLSVLYKPGAKGSGVKRHQLNTLAVIARVGGIGYIVVRNAPTAAVYALPVDSDGAIGPFDRGTKTLHLSQCDEYKIASIAEVMK